MGFGTWLHQVAGRPFDARAVDRYVLLIEWCAPNLHQLMSRFSPALRARPKAVPAALTWRPSLRWTVAMLGVLVFCVAQLHSEVRFLHFQV